MEQRVIGDIRRLRDRTATRLREIADELTRQGIARRKATAHGVIKPSPNPQAKSRLAAVCARIAAVFRARGPDRVEAFTEFMTDEQEQEARDRRSPTISDQLRALIRADGRTGYAIGKEAGVDSAMLSRFLNGERSLQLDTVDHLRAPSWACNSSRPRAKPPCPRDEENPP